MDKPNWYFRRNELEEGQEFMTLDGQRVKLDRRVPGDGTRWYCAVWWNGSYAYMDTEIEPSDLKEKLNEETSAS